MPTIIEVNGSEAIIQDQEWQSKDSHLLTVLKDLQPGIEIISQEIDPDYLIARESLKTLGGEIVAHTIPRYTFDPDVVY